MQQTVPDTSAIAGMDHTRPMRSVPVSVLILAKNEAHRIRECVESVGWAGEIIVIDSGSTDGTPAQAEAAGALVVHHPWEGFAAQRRFALGLARHDWILVLDADERATPRLAEAVSRAVAGGEADGYRISRLNHFLRRPVLHCGWHPDLILRLFRKDRVFVPEASVHEGYVVNGTVRSLEGEILHYSYDHIAEYLEKMNRYTSLEVEDKIGRLMGKRVGPMGMLLHAASRFLRMYVVRGGFLDGLTGLVVSLLSAGYLFVLYAKIGERRRRG